MGKWQQRRVTSTTEVNMSPNTNSEYVHYGHESETGVENTVSDVHDGTTDETVVMLYLMVPNCFLSNSSR